MTFKARLCAKSFKSDENVEKSLKHAKCEKTEKYGKVCRKKNHEKPLLPFAPL